MDFKRLTATILNFSFILHTSCDKNFDTYRPGLPVRISLLHLNIAMTHFYFLTYCFHAKKFSFCSRINFKDLVPPVDPATINAEVNAFNLRLSGKSDIHDAQIDFLKEKKSDNKDAISGAHNKASFFLAFITSVVGLLTFLLPTIYEYHSQSYIKIIILWFLIVSSLLSILNSGIFIFEILNVKGYVRYKFKDLSPSKGDNFELLYHYFEWKAGDAERVIVISLLKNAIKYSVSVFCFSILLWVFIQIFPSEKVINQETFSMPIYSLVNNLESNSFEGGVKNETVLI